jgi:ABC-type transporter Mla subunit MlaD
MTSDQRLDQLEPVIGELVAQLDLHTAQLKRISVNVSTVVTGIVKQSDNITFLLTEVAGLKTQLTNQDERLTRIEDMVTAIYQAIQKPSGN